MTRFTESEVEGIALGWLKSFDWNVVHGPDIAPDTPGAERADYGDVVLARRLRDAFARLNPDLPAAALDDAFRRLTRPDGATLGARNRAFHRMAVDGVTVEYRDGDGAVRGAPACIGTLTAGREWFKLWRTITGERLADRRLDCLVSLRWEAAHGSDIAPDAPTAKRMDYTWQPACGPQSPGSIPDLPSPRRNTLRLFRRR